MRRFTYAIGGIAATATLWLVLPIGSGAQTSDRAAQIERKIERVTRDVRERRSSERVLTSDLQAYSRRIQDVEGRLNQLSARRDRVQSTLDARAAELEATRRELRSARAKLARLRLRLNEARSLLAVRLREHYKAGQPDLITVVLRAQSFSDLLDQREMMQRVVEQDQRIITRATEARQETLRTERRLDELREAQTKLVAAIAKRRDELDSMRAEVAAAHNELRQARDAKARALERVRSHRHHLERKLHDLEAQQARIRRQLARAASGVSLPSGGSGRLSWPVHGTFTSPFGPRWGRLHAGIDIAAPSGTPIRAAAGGRVVLMQGVAESGGYGNYTCVAHTSSLSTCYAHQSRFGTSMGANVSAGEVIGYVGNTGHSFGDHLHFETRVNGTPVDPMGYL